MPDKVQIDLIEGIIIVRVDGRADDATFDAYLQRYSELVERRVPYATVYSALPGARMPHAAHARQQVTWMKEYSEFARKYCRGLAFSFRSPLMRGVLRGILAMQPLGAPHTVVDDEDEALKWARSRLEARVSGAGPG